MDNNNFNFNSDKPTYDKNNYDRDNYDRDKKKLSSEDFQKKIKSNRKLALIIILFFFNPLIGIIALILLNFTNEGGGFIGEILKNQNPETGAFLKKASLFPLVIFAVLIIVPNIVSNGITFESTILYVIYFSYRIFSLRKEKNKLELEAEGFERDSSEVYEKIYRVERTLTRHIMYIILLVVLLVGSEIYPEYSKIAFFIYTFFWITTEIVYYLIYIKQKNEDKLT